MATLKALGVTAFIFCIIIVMIAGAYLTYLVVLAFFILTIFLIFKRLFSFSRRKK